MEHKALNFEILDLSEFPEHDQKMVEASQSKIALCSTIIIILRHGARLDHVRGYTDAEIAEIEAMGGKENEYDSLLC